MSKADKHSRTILRDTPSPDEAATVRLSRTPIAHWSIGRTIRFVTLAGVAGWILLSALAYFVL